VSLRGLLIRLTGDLSKKYYHIIIMSSYHQRVSLQEENVNYQNMMS